MEDVPNLSFELRCPCSSPTFFFGPAPSAVTSTNRARKDCPTKRCDMSPLDPGIHVVCTSYYLPTGMDIYTVIWQAWACTADPPSHIGQSFFSGARGILAYLGPVPRARAEGGCRCSNEYGPLEHRLRAVFCPLTSDEGLLGAPVVRKIRT